MLEIKQKILDLKSKLPVTIVAHHYQKDEIFNMADITGDSLELAQKAQNTPTPYIIFCGVGFMGQSVKILAPNKHVLMPKIACCAMAKMISQSDFLSSINTLQNIGINIENILPVTYINSSAEVKAEVGKLGGMVCTSSNAQKILSFALQKKKKIFFIPDRCLGQNLARMLDLQSIVLDQYATPEQLRKAELICYDGFCSVHQLFTKEDIDFYREKFNDIIIAVHPECPPDVAKKADFIGSTSQLIQYINSLPLEQKVAVGTEFNMVNRLRKKNTYVLSSTKPQCPTMNETTLEDLYATLLSIQNGQLVNEIFIDSSIAYNANLALKRMFEI